MENQEELTFIYSPINDSSPLAVLVTENEELVVHEIKKMLLKSQSIKEEVEEESTCRIPLIAKCSENKHFCLLGDFEVIEGIKAMDKFVYAFELSYPSPTCKCMLCKKMCKCALKKHVGKNCFFIVCDFCVNNYFKIPSKTYECPVCYESVPKISFITIRESRLAISILNVPLVLNKLNIDVAVNKLYVKSGEPCLIKVPVTGNIDNLIQKGGYSIHFMFGKNHDCSKCFYQKDSTFCDPPESNKEVGHENVCADVNNIKIPKIEQSIDKFNFQKQNSRFEEAIDNWVKHFQQQRETTLNFYQEKSRKIVIEGLQNVTQEFERFTRTFAKNRPSRNFIPFENLKFSGKNDFMHPMRFIQDFEFFAYQEKLNDYEQQFFFGQSLTQGAANWLKVRGYGRTFPEMKESFLNFFWDEDDQNRLRSFLKFGKYNKNCGLSMSEYFYKYAIEANYLDTIPEEKTLTGWLTEHFDIMIQAKMDGNHVKNIDEVLHRLKNLEITDKNGTREPSEKSQNPENEDPTNFFSSSSLKKVLVGTWEDSFGSKYEGIKKNGNCFHRCMSDRIWALHSLSYNNYQSKIQHFDVSCEEASSRFLTNVPCNLHHIYTDINGDSVKFQILGPITVAKQKDNQLIVSTCPSFKSVINLISGQLVYIESGESIKPCSVITCSIPEDTQFRYVIPNSNEQIVCLTCKDNIEEVQFRENRTIAVGDLSVCYFEQSFKKRRHILRFLNKNFCIVYSVWDDAVVLYNPLEPTYH